MSRARWVLHADMDAFYASIEQRDRPELRGLPVIVGGSSRRGVVSAASYEARRFGVRSAMPGFRARELCPDGVFLAPDMKKYAAVSAAVHRVFEEFTSDIEPIALDEAFLDVSGSVGLFGGPMELGYRLKARVREVTGLVVSCALAPTKLVAKIACSLSKPDGLLLVPEGAVRWLLDPLPVRRLWGVGPVLEDELVAAGFDTLRSLADADLTALKRLVGDRAYELSRRARGEDPRPVSGDREARSYGEEATFEHDVTEREQVVLALTAHAHAVAARLRHDGLAARTVTLRIKLGRRLGARPTRLGARALPAGVQRPASVEPEEPRYPLLTRSRTLPAASDDGRVLRDVAVALWDAAGISEGVRLLGVSTSNLEPAQRQLELFAPRAATRSRRLGPALDAIRQRFGSDAIHVASERPEKQSPSLRKKRGE